MARKWGERSDEDGFTAYKVGRNDAKMGHDALPIFRINGVDYTSEYMAGFVSYRQEQQNNPRTQTGT